MAIEFNWCYWMAIEFGRHSHMATERFLVTIVAWQLKTFSSPQCLSPPPSPLCFFPFFIFPPLMATEMLLVTILCDPFIKKWGY